VKKRRLESEWGKLGKETEGNRGTIHYEVKGQEISEGRGVTGGRDRLVLFFI